MGDNREKFIRGDGKHCTHTGDYKHDRTDQNAVRIACLSMWIDIAKVA